ncbi:hypothetical protein ElyMa_000788900 [Elysia marginata]|uniref:Uncharacterized protein n=1 Tax=Elysia marginata TaxID=1093978 RepID=A0AAV4GTM1_9GAST|nr:hypothetical protein ElyMa_000788900 [Elysia marginata]
MYSDCKDTEKASYFVPGLHLHQEIPPEVLRYLPEAEVLFSQADQAKEDRVPGDEGIKIGIGVRKVNGKSTTSCGSSGVGAQRNVTAKWRVEARDAKRENAPENDAKGNARKSNARSSKSKNVANGNGVKNVGNENEGER